MVFHCHLQAWVCRWLVDPGPRKPNAKALAGMEGWCHSVSKAWVHTLGGVFLRVQPGSLGTPGFTDDTGGLAVRRAREAL